MRWLLSLFAVLSIACSTPTAPEPDLPSSPSLYSTIQPGKHIGMFNWHNYGQKPFTGGIVTVAPKYLDNSLQTARAANNPVFVGFPRAEVWNSQHQFVLSRALDAVDRYAAGPLKPDSVRKYAKYIDGWYLIDEPFCAHCWGGRAARQADLVTYANYFRKKIDPDHLVPMAIRVAPSLLVETGNWGNSIDVAWTVWRTNMPSSLKSTMDHEWGIAKNHGWKMVGAINAGHCNGGSSAPCTASQVRQFLPVILKHPGVCASINWKWYDRQWDKADYRDAWTDAANVARNQSGSCK